MAKPRNTILATVLLQGPYGLRKETLVQLAFLTIAVAHPDDLTIRWAPAKKTRDATLIPRNLHSIGEQISNQDLRLDRPNRKVVTEYRDANAFDWRFAWFARKQYCVRVPMADRKSSQGWHRKSF
jgi:hypothetical protein